MDNWLITKTRVKINKERNTNSSCMELLPNSDVVYFRRQNKLSQYSYQYSQRWRMSIYSSTAHKHNFEVLLLFLSILILLHYTCLEGNIVLLLVTIRYNYWWVCSSQHFLVSPYEVVSNWGPVSHFRCLWIVSSWFPLLTSQWFLLYICSMPSDVELFNISQKAERTLGREPLG